LKNFVEGFAGYAAWSKDGSRIAYSKEIDGRWSIHFSNKNGGDEKRITNGDYDAIDPEWKDGKSLIFSRSHESGYSIAIADIESGAIATVTEPNGMARRPAFFVDGVIYEQYENMRSSIRFFTPSTMAFSKQRDATAALPHSQSASHYDALTDKEPEHNFSTGFFFPALLASFGDDPANNQFLWTLGVKTGFVSQGFNSNNSRVFAVPKANLKYTNRYYPFDIVANVYYQFRDIGDTQSDTASFSGFRTRDIFGADAGGAFRLTDTVAIGAGYLGFKANRQASFQEDFQYTISHGFYAQARVNTLVMNNLYPDRGFAFNARYASFSRAFGSDYDYGALNTSAMLYCPVGGEYTLEAVLRFDKSDGHSPQRFDLGWDEGLRGIQLNRYDGTRRLTARLGVERPFISDGRIVFGNSVLRDARVTAFADIGAVSDSDALSSPPGGWKKSAGVHFRFDVYWFQSIGFPVGVFFAREISDREPDSVFAITTGLEY